MTQTLLPPIGGTTHPVTPGPIKRWYRRTRGWRYFLAALAVATGVLVHANTSDPLRMTLVGHIGATGIEKSYWPLGKQMYLVFPVPSFNRPVLISDVELVTISGAGYFDHPAAYLLSPYSGAWPGTNLTDIKPELTSPRIPLRDLPLYKADGRASMVVPVNIHQRGCHYARVVLKLRALDDGSTHTLSTIWEVGLDTGLTRSSGFTC